MPSNTYQSEFTGAQMDSRLTAVAALQEAVTALETAVAGKYAKPSEGIPSTDMDAAVQAALAKALTAVQSLADYYTKSEVDAIAAAISAAVNSTSGEVVASLPDASASTLGKIYYVGPTSGEYARYVTSYDGTTYSWLSIGTTDVDMTQYATKAELGQLDQKVGDSSSATVKDSLFIGKMEAGSVKYSTGASATSTVNKRTAYLEISEFAGGTLIYSRMATTSSSPVQGLAFYKSDKTYISGQAWIGDAEADALVEQSISVPANAKFVRFCVSGALESSAYLKHPRAVDVYSTGLGEKVQILEETKKTVDDTILPLLSVDKTMEVDTTFTAGTINATGGVGPSSYAKYSGFVQIQPKHKYSIFTKTSSAWYCAYYETAEDATCIYTEALGANSNTQQLIELEFPPQAKYMRVTVDNSSTAKFYDTVQEVAQESLAEDIKTIKDEAVPKKYYIKLDGSGDYATLPAALTALADDESNKEIYLEGGTHDILSQMGGQEYINSIPADVSSGDWPIYSNFVPDNTKIIGIGNATLNFQVPDETSQARMAVLCPLAFRKNVTVENLTINAKNCRYCIHDETGGDFSSYTKNFKNVKLYKTGGGYSQAYGGGFSKNNNIIFDGCLFSSNESPVWSVHDNVSGSDFTNIVIKNCIFVTDNDADTALRFGTLNDLNGKKDVMIENCFLGSGKIYLQDSASFPNRYALQVMGSGTPTITDDSGENPYPAVIY